MNARLRDRIALIIAATVFFGISLVVFGAISVGKFSDVEENWKTYNREIVSLSDGLLRLERAIGYGGFIHGFKNLVLRRDPRYIPLVQADLDDAYAEMNRIAAFLLTDTERKALAQFRSVIDQYAAKFQLAKSMVAENAAAAEIDVLVKVDDTPALEALETLLDSIDRRAGERERQSQESLDQAVLFLSLGFGLVLIAVGVSALLIYTIRRLSDINQDLENANNNVNALIDLAPSAMVVSDPDGLIVRTNDHASDVFGYSRREFGEMKVEDLMPGELRTAHRARRVNHFRKGIFEASPMVGLADLKAKHKDGHVFPVEISLGFIAGRTAPLAIAVIRDETERKRAEAELIEAHAEAEAALAELETAHAELAEANKELTRLATTDPLTGACNRRCFLETAGKEVERSHRYDTKVSFIALDADHFKQVNDTYGHGGGDAVLVFLAETCRNTLRPTDMVARFGGEEFVMMLPETGLDEAMEAAGRLRRAIETTPVGFEGRDIRVTVSLGVASVPRHGENVEAALLAADEALYRSKEGGRNQVTPAAAPQTPSAPR